MWPFKKKIKTVDKRRPFRKHETSSYSAWDSLSIIEKFAMIILPVVLWFINYMVVQIIFEFKPWINASISLLVFGAYVALIWFFANWMTQE